MHIVKSNKTLHAFLIGINNYSRKPLDGCVNDVQHLSQFLEALCNRTGLHYNPLHFLGANERDWARPDIQALLAQNPPGFRTPKNCLPTVVRVSQEGFPFFEGANPGDICLFYYSGHGTLINTPPEFSRRTANQKNQAIVLLPQPNPLEDAPLLRREILIDKELNYLIWKSWHDRKKHKTGSTDVHFLAVMDCCYAGDATRMDRGLKERSMAFSREVELDQYIGIEAYIKQKLQDGQIKYEVPFAPHVLLAASDPDQVSKEMDVKILDREGNAIWRPQGLFTHFLVNELQRGGYRYNYYQLIERVRFQLEEKVMDQSPHIDIVGIENGGFLQFLTGKEQLSITDFQIFFNANQGQWLLNAGSLDGLVPSNHETGSDTILERMDLDHGDPNRFLRVTKVMGTQAIIEGNFTEADKKIGPIDVQLTQLAAGGLTFGKGPELSEADWQVLLQAKKKYRLRFATLSNNGNSGEYLIHKDADDQYFVSTPGSIIPVFKRVSGILELFKCMELMARWQRIRDLRNKTGQNRLPGNLIQINLQKIEGIALTKDNAVANFDFRDSCHDLPITFSANQDLHSPIVLSYAHNGHAWQKPGLRGQIQINNEVAGRFPGKYYVSVLYLSSKFGITNKYLPKESLLSGKDQTAELSFDEKINQKHYRFVTIRLNVDDQYLKYGVTEITDYLKIYISSRNFSTDKLSQKGLELDILRSTDTDILAKTAKEKDSEGYAYDLEYLGPEWSVLTIPIKIRRPLESLKITQQRVLGTNIFPELPQHLGFGQLRTALAGQIKWRSSKLLDRIPANFYWGNGILPQVFSELNLAGSNLDLDYIELLFDQTRRLEDLRKALIYIQDIRQLRADEAILPYVYDRNEDLILPAGLTIENQVQISLLHPDTPRVENIPGERSLGSAYGIFFKKFLLDRFTRKREYPKLCFLFSSEDNIDEVKAAIADTNKPVIIFIHGLYGDYEQVAQAFKATLGGGTVLGDYYDVVLAFQYESLHTPLEESAGELKKKIDELIAEKENIEFHFFGYSMGGLLARYYVEHLKGYEHTSELVMLGTPNDGTIWASVQQWVVGSIAAAINLPAIANPMLLPFLLAIGRFFMKSFDTFSQMKSADSGILSALAHSLEAGQTRYHLLAGNTYLISPENKRSPKQLLPKLLSVLQNKYFFGTIDLALFNSSDNDLFATQKSMKACKFLKEENIHDQIPCGHFSYYSHPESLKVIEQIIKEIGNA